jgi:hypothetical protein
MGRKPTIWTAADRDYETLRIGMQTLFQHIGIETPPAAASTTFCRSENASFYVPPGTSPGRNGPPGSKADVPM